MKTILRIIISLVILLSSHIAYAELDRRIAVLDLAPKNGETTSSLRGLEQALSVIGIPYIKTTQTSVAVGHTMIITTSYLSDTTLSSGNLILEDYVSNGGVIVSTNVKGTSYYDLFGISSLQRLNNRYRMVWQTNTGDATLHYFDDPNEKTISLGDTTRTSTIYTRGYGLSEECLNAGSCRSLANFDDGTVAVIKNQYGLGTAYTLGFSYTDLILRNQLDLDYSAQRTYSNDFEPTTDTIMLFLRSVYENHVPVSVWKHTSPWATKATLIITHDVDSRSAIAWMNDFAEMEQNRDVIASYNVTTHYIDDATTGDYYDTVALQGLLDKGMSIDSHSVGHFDDFNHFPIGTLGNTRENYQPYYHGLIPTGYTTDGTLYGELEVSKNLLENDFKIQVKTFRAGYLYYHNEQIAAMEVLGYEYDSSYSANDLLTNFPFLQTKTRSFSSEWSSIYEIPMTVSDKGLTDYNYLEKSALWVDMIQKNAANGAPTVLLIHPNRDYKITAEEDMLDQLAISEPNLFIGSSNAFGDYWKARNQFDFTSTLSNDGSELTISLIKVPMDKIGLFIKDGQGISKLKVCKGKKCKIRFQQEDVGSNDVIIHTIK